MGLIIVMICLVASFAVSCFTMIHGWGIQPENWLIICAGSFVCFIIGMMAAAAGKMDS